MGWEGWCLAFCHFKAGTMVDNGMYIDIWNFRKDGIALIEGEIRNPAPSWLGHYVWSLLLWAQTAIISILLPNCSISFFSGESGYQYDQYKVDRISFPRKLFLLQIVRQAFSGSSGHILLLLHVAYQAQHGISLMKRNMLFLEARQSGLIFLQNMPHVLVSVSIDPGSP